MSIELLVNNDSEVTLTLDEKDGKITLLAKHSKVRFVKAYENGQLRCDELKSSQTERGYECPVEIKGTGVTGIEVHFVDNSMGPFEVYIAKKAYVTIKTEPKPTERWPITPQEGQKLSLKQEAQQAYQKALQDENSRIEQYIENTVKTARELLKKAASKRETKVEFGVQSLSEFSPNVALTDESPIVLTVESGKTEQMKRLLSRLINDEQLTVHAFRNPDGRGETGLRLELVFQ